MAGAWDCAGAPWWEGSKGVFFTVSSEVRVATGGTWMARGSVVTPEQPLRNRYRRGDGRMMERAFPWGGRDILFFPVECKCKVDQQKRVVVPAARCGGRGREFAVPKIELGDLSQRVAVWQTLDTT